MPPGLIVAEDNLRDLPPHGGHGVPFNPVLPAVPEPQTYALMLAGVVFLVFAARRKSRRD